jgi:hypothetical protein
MKAKGNGNARAEAAHDCTDGGPPDQPSGDPAAFRVNCVLSYSLFALF